MNIIKGVFMEINKIFKGDSIEVLKKIPSESVDFIFADPPYYMQTEGELLRIDGTKFNGVEDEWDKFENFQDYDNFSKKWLGECRRVLKKNGTIAVIGSFQNIYRIGNIMQDLGYWILNDIIWKKTNPVPNFSGKRFCNSHETILWCSKDKKSKITFNYKTMKYLNGDKQEKSVWEIPLCTGNERLKDEEGNKLHSTQKPEKLLYKILISMTKPNDIVLDPFFGTGTTGAVAVETGRNYIGIEREEKYIKAAEKRIASKIYQKNMITELLLEVKPPKVPLKKLVEKGYLKENQTLYNSLGEAKVKVLSNGDVFDGNEKLSIHKMSAKILNKTNNNGWDYFYVMNNGKLISLNDLRYQYAKEVNNEKQIQNILTSKSRTQDWRCSSEWSLITPFFYNNLTSYNSNNTII